MNLFNRLFLLISLTLSTVSFSGTVPLIPYPTGEVIVGARVPISGFRFEKPASDAELIEAELRDVCEFHGVKLLDSPAASGVFTVSFLDDSAKSTEGAYTLAITPDTQRVAIKAEGYPGFFNGLQTLRQLISKENENITIPACTIQDEPTFQLRGVMLDVGRYYMTPAFIKELVRNISRYKINTLQLHLTDDPGWRFEVKRYPHLTDAAYHWPSRLPGKYYTQDELRDLVEYCARLSIAVMPEIDMPGHSQPFRKAMGFSMQTPEGLKAVKEILDEAIAIFPGPYFHIGSDETAFTMKEFMPEVVKHLQKKGKKPVVWSPGYRPEGDAVLMAWGENEAGYRLDSSMPHIDSNGFYLDWMDAQSGVYQIFFQQPCEVPKGNDKALGSIMAVWCDGNLSGERRILEQYPFYPGLLTFSERIWRGAPEKRKDLMAQLPMRGTPEWEAFDRFEDRLIFHRDRYFGNQPFAYVKQSRIAWHLIGPFDHKGQNDKAFEPEQTLLPAYEDQGKTLTWKGPVYGGAIWFRHLYAMFNMQRGAFRPNHWPTLMTDALGKGDGTCYALGIVESPIRQDVWLMFGLNGMWGHTGGYRTAQAPEQGRWDFSGGDIRLNGQRIPPPEWPFKSLPWGGWGKGRIEDAPLTEEGYFFRPPVKITLEKGINTLLVRSVFGHWKGDIGQRKWFFCCIPVNWDGIHYTEVKNLTWHTELPEKWKVAP